MMSTDDYNNSPLPKVVEPASPYVHRGPYVNDGQVITCEIEHPAYGWIPWSYVAGQHDEAGELTGQEILAAIAKGSIDAATPNPQVVVERQRQLFKKQRDQALQSITVDLNGKVVQVRPGDVQNFQLAIQIGQPQRWILADNSVSVLTVEEMSQALSSGIAQAQVIWETYADNLESLDS